MMSYYSPRHDLIQAEPISQRQEPGTVKQRQSIFGGEVLIAQGTDPNNIQSTGAVSEIPHNARGRIIIEGPGVGLFADLAGAEQAFAAAFVPQGLEVIDVFGQGSNTAIVLWRNATAESGFGNRVARLAFPLLIIAVIGAIALALIALGWVIFHIRILLETPGGSIVVYGIVAIAILFLLPRALPKRQGRQHERLVRT